MASGRITQSSKPQPSVPKASVKTGQETLDLTGEDLQHKIINLRFTHKPNAQSGVPKTFTIRSDYEIVFTNDVPQYIVCRVKPSIKVTFNQVADDTVVSITVDITNLFIKDASKLEEDDEPIQQVEISMGYLSQMPNWTQDFSKLPIEDFYALKDSGVSQSSFNRIAATKVRADILTIERLSGPPDSGTRFNCVVGTMTTGLRWTYTAESLAHDISIQKSSSWNGKTPQNSLPDHFFAYITRRFFRTNIRYDINTVSSTKPNSFGIPTFELVQGVTIYDESGQIISTLETVDGRMSEKDADAYGVQVYLSRVLWETPERELPKWGLSTKEAAQVKPIDRPASIVEQDSMSAQFKEIKNRYTYVRYYSLMDGNIFAYHVNEKSPDFFRDPFVNKNQENGVFKLPAVYDIKWGGLREITCPFFGLVGSMTTVAFQARYPLNDLVGNFYHPAPANNMFLVLLASVEFSTDGPENTVTLSCVDVEGTYTPKTNDDGSIVPAAVPDVADAPVRNKVWKKLDITVVYGYKGLPNTMDCAWSGIIRWLVETATQYIDRWGGVMPTAAQAVTALQGWNTTLFTTSRFSYGVSLESSIFGTTLPILYGKEHNPVNPGFADIVHVQVPFLLSTQYHEDEEIVT